MGKYFSIEIKTIKEPTNIKEAREAIQEALNLTDIGEDSAIEIADKFKDTFSVGEYGCGRTYYPPGTQQKRSWCNNYYGDYDENDMNVEGFWISSSEQC